MSMPVSTAVDGFIAPPARQIIQLLPDDRRSPSFREAENQVANQVFLQFVSKTP